MNKLQSAKRALLLISLFCTISIILFTISSRSMKSRSIHANEGPKQSRQILDVVEIQHGLTVASQLTSESKVTNANKPTTVKPLTTAKTDTVTEPKTAHKYPPKTDNVCQPKTNLMFMKTHKTGSSCLQNVLTRFAWKHNLVFALPTRNILFRYRLGQKFKKEFVAPVRNNRTINLLLHHMIFNYEEVAKVVPTDSTFFTILRDPATQFESSFEYMKPNTKAFQRVPGNNSFGKWMEHPERYFNGSSDGPFWWFGKNNMFFDLGFNNLDESGSYLDNAIESLDNIFDLVMISEYFDMSLMLLKDLLCWSMDDILSLPTNSRDLSSVTKIGPELREKIYTWNKADTAIYRYFNKTFWKRVEEYGIERMEKDVAEYQARKLKLKEFCVEDKMYLNSEIKESIYKVYNPKGLKMEQYKLRNEARTDQTCVGLILPEISWFKRIWARQAVPRKIVPKKDTKLVLSNGKPVVIHHNPVLVKKP